VRGDRTGEGAPAQEVLVVSEADAVADTGAEAGGLELPMLDSAAHRLLVGADVPGHVGDGQQLVSALVSAGARWARRGKRLVLRTAGAFAGSSPAAATRERDNCEGSS
jgi:hypothetical protein